MGWSESYWEDVRADWARLQAERPPGGEGETLTLEESAPSRPADGPGTHTGTAGDPAQSGEAQRGSTALQKMRGSHN